VREGAKPCRQVDPVAVAVVVAVAGEPVTRAAAPGWGGGDETLLEGCIVAAALAAAAAAVAAVAASCGGGGDEPAWGCLRLRRAPRVHDVQGGCGCAEEASGGGCNNDNAHRSTAADVALVADGGRGASDGR
jgi:hypothetical protein